MWTQSSSTQLCIVAGNSNLPSTAASLSAETRQPAIWCCVVQTAICYIGFISWLTIITETELCKAMAMAFTNTCVLSSYYVDIPTTSIRQDSWCLCCVLTAGWPVPCCPGIWSVKYGPGPSGGGGGNSAVKCVRFLKLHIHDVNHWYLFMVAQRKDHISIIHPNWKTCHVILMQFIRL